VREFKGVEGWIRKHFFIYRAVRSAAPFLCRFFTLEEGFEFLGTIKPLGQEFVILDIGANDGTSIRMIRQFHRKAKIVAFDPITQPKFTLDSIDFRAVALGEIEATKQIYTPVVRNFPLTQYSSVYKEKLLNQVVHDLGVRPSQVELQVKTIEITKLDSLELAPYFIKLDVEGSELEVLRGGRETISRYQPSILIEIQNASTYQLVKVFFESLEYTSIATKPRRNLTRANCAANFTDEYDPRFNNYIWVPRSPSISWSFSD
jgi:FkbM family methyltransferase